MPPAAPSSAVLFSIRRPLLCVRNRQKAEPAPPRPLIVVEGARMSRLTGYVVDAAAFDAERRRPRNDDSIMRAAGAAAVARTCEICVRFGTSSRLFPPFSAYFQTQAAAARSLDCASTCGALFVGRGLQLRAMTALKRLYTLRHVATVKATTLMAQCMADAASHGTSARRLGWDVVNDT